MPEVTKRQRETLFAIHSLTAKNGVPPTIRELREALDLASDQSVIEMLARLEKVSLIIRDKKQARSILLTKKAKDSLGIIPMLNDTPSESGPLELNDQQQRVNDKLSQIDLRLGRIYRGSLSALRLQSNEDFLAQSAHSLREVIVGLSMKGDVPKEVKERLEKNRNTGGVVQGLLYFFDPLGAVGLNQNPYVYLYNEYQDKLNNIAHHRVRPSLEEYQTLVSTLEYFLLRYIFPAQLEIYRILDEALQKGPDTADATDLKMLITRNVESYRYFFKHADERWLSFLRTSQFLDAKWEVGEYLSRIAHLTPQEVFEVFNDTQIPEDDWQAKTAFALAASKLPAKFAAQTVARVLKENWVKETRATLLHYRLQDLFKNLLAGQEYAAALALADALMDIFPHGYGSHGSVDTRAYISEHEYGQLIAEMGKVPPTNVYPFLKLLSEKLVKALKEVHARGDEGDDDYSYIWRPAIEDDSHNHSFDRVDNYLIAGVRDLLLAHTLHVIEHTGAAKKDLDAVLTNVPQYPLLTRLRLYILRQFPDAFKDEVEEIVVTPSAKNSTWHEYSMLANQEFPKLSSDAKKRYFAVIDSMDKVDDEFADSWRVRLLVIVREHLAAAQKKKYAALLKHGENLEERFFTSYMREATITGPNSPKAESDLTDKTPSEVISILKSWEPTDEFFGPSRSGLGMTFRDVVRKQGSMYSAAAKEFLDEGLRPVFVYNFLSGLIESQKQKTELDWDTILAFITALIERDKNGTLPTFTSSKEDRMESDWENVMQEMARLLLRGFDTNGFTLKHRKETWGAVAHLAEHQDPTPEHEAQYGGNNSDPFTMSINTVRGDAFHAVFSYIFWYNRVEKNSNEKWLNSVPDEAKLLLEKHLNLANDSSLTIRSVYGRYFPWLLSYGGEWAESLVPQIFPTDNASLRYAAWETYLSHNLFQDAYRLLRPLYELAVEDLKKGRVPKRRYWSDPAQRIAEHVMIAFVFEVEKGPNPFYEVFFSQASGKYRGIAVSMAGRSYISRDNFPHGEKQPEISVLKRFWEWRLKESTSPSELREFGWWAKLGRLGDKWMLEQLLATVEKTKGDIDGEYVVMDSLNSLSEEYPFLCAKILKYIFASNSRVDRYAFLHMGELRSAMEKVLRSSDEEAKAQARETIDYLLKLGFEGLRTLGDSSMQKTP